MAKREMTPEARRHWNAYQRAYRRAHPDRVAQWRINAARRLAERSEQQQHMTEHMQ